MQDTATTEFYYICFICLSTAFRAFEAGVVASTVPAMQQTLGLTYTQIGIIASSPDVGMIPGALMAGAIFRWVSPNAVLRLGYWWIGLCSLALACNASFIGLVATRASCSFWWSFAIVHYPSWINSHGTPEKKTRLMALNPLTMLFGMAVGYSIGGAASHDPALWTRLYAYGAALMLFCAVLSLHFESSVVDAVSELSMTSTTSRAEVDQETLNLNGSERRSWSLLPALSAETRSLFGSPIFLMVVWSGACVSGAAALLLYFISSVGPVVTGWSMHKLTLAIALGMVPSTIGGTLIGMECLSRIGGYENHNAALLLIALCSACTLGATLMEFVAFCVHAPPGVFILSTLCLIFFPAVPTTAINGVAQSVIPNTAHQANGFLFAAMHFSKLVTPSIGGVIIDYIGLVKGFIYVLMSIALVMTATSSIAYVSFTRLGEPEKATA